MGNLAFNMGESKSGVLVSLVLANPHAHPTDPARKDMSAPRHRTSHPAWFPRSAPAASGPQAQQEEDMRKFTIIAWSLVVIASLAVIALAVSPVSAAKLDPGRIVIEADCTGTIVRFQVFPGVDADVKVTSTIPNTPAVAFDEHVDTTARTQYLEILSISGLLADGTVVMTIDHWRTREKIQPMEC